MIFFSGFFSRGMLGHILLKPLLTPALYLYCVCVLDGLCGLVYQCDVLEFSLDFLCCASINNGVYYALVISLNVIKYFINVII